MTATRRRAVTLFVGTLLVASATVAPEASAQPAVQGPESSRTDTIIIAARRRDDDVQSVPIAITTLSGDQAEDRGVIGTSAIPSIARRDLRQMRQRRQSLYPRCWSRVRPSSDQGVEVSPGMGTTTPLQPKRASTS